MVLLLVAIAIGVLVVIVLVAKYAKTNPKAVIGVDTKCIRCGSQLSGWECLKCKKSKESFGV